MIMSIFKCTKTGCQGELKEKSESRSTILEKSCGAVWEALCGKCGAEYTLRERSETFVEVVDAGGRVYRVDA